MTMTFKVDKSCVFIDDELWFLDFRLSMNKYSITHHATAHLDISQHN